MWKSRRIPQRRGLARQLRESLRGRPVLSQGAGMSPALPCGMIKNTRKASCDHDASNLRSAQHIGIPPASRCPEVRTQHRPVPPLIQRWIPHERQHYTHSFPPPPRTEPRRVPRTQPPRTETGRSASGGDAAILTLNGGGLAGGGGASLVGQGCSLAGGGARMVTAVSPRW